MENNLIFKILNLFPGSSREMMGIRNAGFEHTGYFRLPARVWEESYYIKAEEKPGDLIEEFKDNEVALTVIKGLKKEIEIFEKYTDEYGCTYNVMRKPF